LIEAMRAQGRRPDHPEDAFVKGLISHLSGLEPPPCLCDVTADAHPAAESVDPAEFRFLAPAKGADELGWLGGYRVMKVLGAGGMGVVFEAEDPKLKRRVALKVLKPALAEGQAARQRFLREAQAIAALEHDHIVAIHQVAEDNGVPFLAMPLLRGETLQDRLQHTGALPLAEVLRIAREMALGLAVAHEHGLIHRDVKPANVLLSDEGEVKILDFGLAKLGAKAASEDAPTLLREATTTQAGSLLGTVAYMSPEQARGEDVGAQSDLYALGVLFYEMLTGQLPFRANDRDTLLEMQRTAPAAKPTDSESGSERLCVQLL
jgi:serine/threonine protein kinase